MTRFLWTGESEYCVCGYHITDHETSQLPISIAQPPLVICRGARNVRAIGNCECDEFRPYRTRIATEEDYDVVEKEIWEAHGDCVNSL